MYQRAIMTNSLHAAEADSSAALKNRPCIVCNSEVHCRIYKFHLSLPRSRSIQSTFPIPLLEYPLHIILPSTLRFSNKYLSLRSPPPKPSLHSTICATYPTHLIVLYLITQILFGKECKSWSFSLCYLLQSHHLTLLHPRHLQMWTTRGKHCPDKNRIRQAKYV